MLKNTGPPPAAGNRHIRQRLRRQRSAYRVTVTTEDVLRQFGPPGWLELFAAATRAPLRNYHLPVWPGARLNTRQALFDDRAAGIAGWPDLLGSR